MILLGGLAAGCQQKPAAVSGDTWATVDGRPITRDDVEKTFRRTQDAAATLSAEEAMTRKTTKLVREGRYAAEVRVELIEESGGWAPYLSLEDALKLDAVRQALRQGDVADAAKHGQVFELLPVSA